MATLLQMTKTALQLMTDDAAIENQLNMLILSGIADLANTAGVNTGGLTSPGVDIGNSTPFQDVLTAWAVITYVRCHFGQPDEYDNLKRSYDEQKAMLRTAFPNGGTNG